MNAREIAFKCLCDVINRHDYASLNMRYRKDSLSAEDHGLLTQIVYGTLRNHRYVRYQWSLYVERMDDPAIAVLLDMSTYQLLLMDKVPEYACVNEAVQIAHGVNNAYAPLVNAVLRKIAGWGAMKITETDFARKLGIETSHPDWLVRMWNAHYGQEICEKLCWDDLNEGRVALRVNTRKTSEEELLKDPLFSVGSIKNCLYYKGNILNTDYFKNNLVIIQSESSQQVVNLLDPKPFEKVLDMCASPGTKSIQMAMAMNDIGEIVAVDVHPHRVQLIENAKSKYEIRSIRTLCQDARNLPSILSLHSWDKILLDAPCSGLGTLKHKPEIKLNIKPEDIDDLVRLQGELLETAALLLKPGGCIVYSTCTINKKENEKQISDFLVQHPELEQTKERLIFPFDSGSDGFYMTRLVKVR